MDDPKRMTLAEVARTAVKFDRFLPDQPYKGVTYCNQFVAYVADAAGCHDLHGLLANQIIDKISVESDKWVMVEADLAQKAANDGQFVIAGASNAAGHGHVCVIIPGIVTWSKMLEDDVPCVANVGNKNECGRPASFYFTKAMKPRYWIWRGGVT